jgi:hypothetical protein
VDEEWEGQARKRRCDYKRFRLSENNPPSSGGAESKSGGESHKVSPGQQNGHNSSSLGLGLVANFAEYNATREFALNYKESGRRTDE